MGMTGRLVGAFVAVVLACQPAFADDPGRGSSNGRAPWVVGATLLNPMTAEVFKRLRERAPELPLPRVDNGPLVRDVQTFCAGDGVDSPDILAISRKMSGAEFDLCAKNGVTDVMEVPIGQEALVLVTRKEDIDFPLTFDTLFRAIAAELPRGDDFLPNTAHTWRDVKSTLPRSEINVIIPSRATVSRQFFDARFLEGACREIFDYKKIFSAEERVAQCVGLRRDGHVVEMGLPYTAETIVAALDQSPPGTIALLSLRYATEAKDHLKVLPLEGVLPTRQTVGHMTYPATRSLTYYVKRNHVKDYNGNGPVVGLREFISEVTRERAIGESGYLVPLGLVPLAAETRAAVRDSALSLSVMNR